MSAHIAKRWFQFREREDGVSAVEYAVMIGIFIAGCILAFVMGGPSTSGSKKPSTVAIKFRDDDRTVRAASVAREERPRTTGASARTTADSRSRSAGTGGSRGGGGGSETGSSFSYQKGDSKSENKNDKSQQNSKIDPARGSNPAAGGSQAEYVDAKNPRSESDMSAEDARQALAALVGAHAGSFTTSEDRVRSASVVHNAGYVEIDLFRCNLRAKTFEYGAPSSGAGRSRSDISGAFYQDANQQWVATITRNAQK